MTEQAMNDRELADRIVACGVGHYDPHNQVLPWLAPNSIDWCEVDEFVRDWRVAGAMLEKLRPKDLQPVMWNAFTTPNDPLPRAINEAAVEALSDERA